MKDLKHLIYFEGLLEDANNDLVKQYQADGKIAFSLGLFHKLVVSGLKQTFEVDQMLKIFQMLHLFL